MIPWDNEGYLYVTKPSGKMYEVEPILHNTYEEAVEAASIWGKNARIVEYKND